MSVKASAEALRLSPEKLFNSSYQIAAHTRWSIVYMLDENRENSVRENLNHEIEIRNQTKAETLASIAIMDAFMRVKYHYLCRVRHRTPELEYIKLIHCCDISQKSAHTTLLDNAFSFSVGFIFRGDTRVIKKILFFEPPCTIILT